MTSGLRLILTAIIIFVLPELCMIEAINVNV